MAGRRMQIHLSLSLSIVMSLSIYYIICRTLTLTNYLVIPNHWVEGRVNLYFLDLLFSERENVTNIESNINVIYKQKQSTMQYNNYSRINNFSA